MDYYIGIDIGGSYTRAGLVQDNKIIYKTQQTTPKSWMGGVMIRTIFALIKDIFKQNNLETKHIKGIGVGVAGLVLSDKGIILSAVNIGTANLDIAKYIHSMYGYGIRVEVCNDVSCFALAQSRTSGIDNLVYLAIGTGINVGVINKGKLFTGADGATIEYGHTFFSPTEEPCTCGLDGCVEQFISGKACTDPKDTVAPLSTLLVNIANTYRPEKIFIGGGFGLNLGPYIKELNKELKKRNYGYKNAPPVRVEMSNIPTTGGILGAALLCSEED